MGRQHITQIAYIICLLIVPGCTILPLEQSIQNQSKAKYHRDYNFIFSTPLEPFSPPDRWRQNFEILRQCILETGQLERPHVRFEGIKWYLTDSIGYDRSDDKKFLGIFLWPRSIVLARSSRIVYGVPLERVSIHEMAHYLSPEKKPGEATMWYLCNIPI